MNHDLLTKLTEIINEVNWADKRDEFIENSEELGIRAKKNKKKIRSEEDNEEVESSEEDEKVETPDESPSTINLSDAEDFDKLKRELNKFRASHSLSDREVSEELEKYFDRLSSNEKKILHVFIKGLTQVTLLDVSGKTAYIPSDMKFSVTKSGSAKSEKIKSKARAQELKDDEEIEDATNTPITIGKESVQEKFDILKIVKENA